MKIFPDITYLSLNTMAQRNLQESDDERNCAEDEKTEDDEFTTYFSENRVEIPQNDTVSGTSDLAKSPMCHL